jgi:hypothetical protein
MCVFVLGLSGLRLELCELALVEWWSKMAELDQPCIGGDQHVAYHMRHHDATYIVNTDHYLQRWKWLLLSQFKGFGFSLSHLFLLNTHFFATHTSPVSLSAVAIAL